MVRFRGIRAIILLGTACALAGCGLSAEAEQAISTCQTEVRGHLKDAGVKKISFGESEVDDEEEGNWFVSGPVTAAGRSGDYACRVVESELDKETGQRIADVRIAPQLLRE